MLILFSNLSRQVLLVVLFYTYITITVVLPKYLTLYICHTLKKKF
jgi:hypothetical protein